MMLKPIAEARPGALPAQRAALQWRAIISPMTIHDHETPLAMVSAIRDRSSRGGTSQKIFPDQRRQHGSWGIRGEIDVCRNGIPYLAPPPAPAQTRLDRGAGCGVVVRSSPNTARQVPAGSVQLQQHA